MAGYLPITLLYFLFLSLFIRIFAGENVEIHLRMKKMGLGMLLGIRNAGRMSVSPAARSRKAG